MRYAPSKSKSWMPITDRSLKGRGHRPSLMQPPKGAGHKPGEMQSEEGGSYERKDLPYLWANIH